MSTSEPAHKINLGFHGGGTISARVKPAELTKLREALGTSGGWHELSADSGTVVLDLARIDYLLVDDEQHRVGF
jgi:hypothetical protein